MSVYSKFDRSFDTDSWNELVQLKTFKQNEYVNIDDKCLAGYKIYSNQIKQVNPSVERMSRKFMFLQSKLTDKFVEATKNDNFHL